MRAWAVFVAVIAVISLPLRAQIASSALSDAEVEQVRDARLVPADSILAFVKFLDARTDRLHDLYRKPRHPGREDDTRDLIQQITSITDELDDNLDDYGERHVDLRKALPKLLTSIEHWTAALNALPEEGAYLVPRKLALESLNDLRDAATELTADQAKWFKAHPPAKAAEQANGPIDIPR